MRLNVAKRAFFIELVKNTNIIQIVNESQINRPINLFPFNRNEHSPENTPENRQLV